MSTGLPYDGDWRDRPPESTTLVVAELGCGCPRWLSAVRYGLIVVAQAEDEAPDALTQRVKRRIDALESRRELLLAAWMVCGSRADREVQDARKALSMAIGSAMGKSRGGRLVIAAARARYRNQDPVWRLVDDLAHGLRDFPVELMVRFSSSPPRAASNVAG